MKFIATLFLLLTPSLALAQKTNPSYAEINANLSPDDVHDAVVSGKSGTRGEVHGLRLNTVFYDVDVVLYTPTAWIRMKARKAAEEYRDVELLGEDTRPVLRVYTASSGISPIQTRTVTRAVVLRSGDGKTVVQPIFFKTRTSTAVTGLGAQYEYEDGWQAEFSLEDVARLRSASMDGEFQVTRVYNYVSRSYRVEASVRVKSKYFKYLP